MLFLTVEMFVLLLASFVVGAAGTGALLHLLVRRTAESISAYVASPRRRR